MFPRTTPTLRAWACLALLAGPARGQDEAPRPEAEAGFANPHLLVTCAWLAEHRADEGLVVVDTRKASEYAEAHVPGALHLATSETFDPERPGDVASRPHVAKLLGARGIGAKTHVVLYDWGKSTSAARVFWTLEMYGHATVSVVDGGFEKWKADGREVTRDEVPASAVEYVFGDPLDVLTTRVRILADLKDEKCVMLDTRSSREFSAGRVPGAVRIDWVENFTTGDVPVYLSPKKLRALYVDRGVTPDKRVHAY